MALEPQMSKLMSRLGWAWRLVMTGLCFVLLRRENSGVVLAQSTITMA